MLDWQNLPDGRFDGQDLPEYVTMNAANRRLARVIGCTPPIFHGDWAQSCIHAIFKAESSMKAQLGVCYYEIGTRISDGTSELLLTSVLALVLTFVLQPLRPLFPPLEDLHAKLQWRLSRKAMQNL